MPEQTTLTPDFSGWATKNDLVCTDGRVIKQDAFLKNDKKRVPLVWQHGHKGIDNVLGHAILENRAFGVYAYGFFNESPNGKIAKEAVQHGDLDSLSIWANNLVQQGINVVHGDIRELSLCLAGANPGAVIDNLSIKHSDGTLEDDDTEALITTSLSFAHADDSDEDSSNEELGDIYESMDEKQKEFLHYMVDQALQHEDGSGVAVGASDASADTSTDTSSDESVDNTNDTSAEDESNDNSEDESDDKEEESEDSETEKTEDDTAKDDELEQNDKSGEHLAHTDQKGLTTMARNAFEQQAGETNSLMHKLTLDQIETIIKDSSKYNGSVKESFLAHAEEGDYGITNIDFLFPDFKTLSNTPEVIARRQEWVQTVLGGVKKSPFSRIKSVVADLTAAEARAKGYIKATEKTEEVFPLLKRTTSPTTIYKKQKLDRDDILDITEIDIIAWLKWEMRFMLDEEIARAILLGDGRGTGNPDKIKDPAGAIDGIGIRSILHDHTLYAYNVELAANVSPKASIEAIVRSRSQYRGSGTPTMFTSDSRLIDLLLIEDKIDRRLYDTEASLASALRVREIVPVEIMEEYPNVVAIIVNLQDYTLGADKGGEISFFDDFDIDFNQEKYLLETRASGGLTKPKSAIIVTRILGTLATPTAPSFDGVTNTITVPTATGITYMIDDEPVTGAVVITENTEIVAVANENYYIASGATTTWTFNYT